MPDNPLVSVVMPNYNGEKYIAQAIESVLAQTYKNYELIVVDDCSTDGSTQIIESLAGENDCVRLIRADRNQGVAEARNTGICQAKGDYIALLDSDDLWASDKLEKQVQTALNTGADIVYCSYDFMDTDGNSIRKPFIVPEETSYKQMLTYNVIGCSTVFAGARLLKEHPFQKRYYHEDYVLWMELLKGSAKAVGLPAVMMHYRVVAGSRSNNKGNAARERWKAYRDALSLTWVESAASFVGYTINGIRKHYL